MSIGQGSQENRTNGTFIERFILRNWIIRLWVDNDSKIYMAGQQAKNSTRVTLQL